MACYGRLVKMSMSKVHIGRRKDMGKFLGHFAEIDIMEQDANKNLTSAPSFPDANGNHTYTYDNTPVTNSATTWHDYAMEWTEDSIILMVDDVVFHTLDNAANPYFDNPHFFC